jgi:hypothetical protein
MTTLIAEDLLLLLLDDDKGHLRHASYLDTAIGGALLVELALGGHVEAQEQEQRWGLGPKALIRPTGSLPGDPVLREAYRLVAEKERSAQDLVGRLGRKRRDPLLERLAERGLVRREQSKVLGLFPRTTWPEADGRHEAELRRGLAAVLLEDAAPDDRLAAVVALLSAMDLAHTVLDRQGRAARDVKASAKQVAEGDFSAKAVKDAIASAQAAMTAVIVASTVTTTSS